MDKKTFVDCCLVRAFQRTSKKLELENPTFKASEITKETGEQSFV